MSTIINYIFKNFLFMFFLARTICASQSHRQKGVATQENFAFFKLYLIFAFLKVKSFLDTKSKSKQKIIIPFFGKKHEIIEKFGDLGG